MDANAYWEIGSFASDETLRHFYVRRFTVHFEAIDSKTMRVDPLLSSQELSLQLWLRVLKPPIP